MKNQTERIVFLCTKSLADKMNELADVRDVARSTIIKAALVEAWSNYVKTK